MFSSGFRNCKLENSAIAVIFAVFMSGVFSRAAIAQGSVDTTGTNGNHTIQGRIYFPSGRRSDARFKVILESQGAGELTVLSDNNGSFGFRRLMPGSYTVVVDGGDDYETVSERVYIDSSASNAIPGIRLPDISRIYTVQISLKLKKNPESLAAPEVLNAGLVNVPKAAVESYFKARALAQQGDFMGAIEQFKAAIAIYPHFPLALNEMGVTYLKIPDITKAIEVLGSAVMFSPDEFSPRLNLGIALLQKKSFPLAEQHLRKAVARDGSVPVAHMYLGIALAKQHKLDEGESELETAIKGGNKLVAQAHYYLGGILWSKGDSKRAADELELYLKISPNASNADQIRETIRQFRNKQK